MVCQLGASKGDDACTGLERNPFDNFNDPNDAGDAGGTNETMKLGLSNPQGNLARTAVGSAAITDGRSDWRGV